MWSRKGVSEFIVMLLASAGLNADITITQLANEGVIISDGATRIMIDGMVVEPYSVYGGLPPDAAALFGQAAGPYSDIDLALASHRHHDHNQPRFACAFLQNSPDTLFVSSSQVLGLMREKCRNLVTTDPRIREIAPQYDEPQVFKQGGATDYVVVKRFEGKAENLKVSSKATARVGDEEVTLSGSVDLKTGKRQAG